MTNAAHAPAAPSPATADAPESIVPPLHAVAAGRPTLVFVHSPTSGASRRAEGFLAQVLQRRRNHHTFTLRRVNYEERPDLAARLGVKGVPAIVVIEAKRVRARLERPRGCADLTAVLAPWLR